MGKKLRASITLAILSLVLVAGLFGLVRPLDEALRDLRFGVEPKAPSGKFVFVDIDTRSIDAVGVWPWPRSIHGKVVDALMAAGADDVAIDVDFSTPSSEAEDAAFEAALADSGGYVHLAALRQLRGADGTERYSLPLPRFRQYADAVTVNVGVGGDGTIRDYPFALVLGGHVYPSLATVLSGSSGPHDRTFVLNYAIDVDAIDRIPIIDILNGNLDPSRVEGRNVVIGASALELRDTFVVPVHGIVPGAMVQILAAETLQPGRMLVPTGWVPIALIIGFIALFALVVARRVPLALTVSVALGMIILVEGAAILLQSRAGLLLETAAIDAAAIVLAIEALIAEVEARRRAQAAAARQRDEVRAILDRVVADNFDGIVVVDDFGRIVAASSLAERLLGDSLPGQMAREVLPPTLAEAVLRVLLQSGPGDDRQIAELELAVAEGGTQVIEYAITRSEIASGRHSAGNRVACLTFRDITERRRSEQRLRYLASHDPLTGALSRLEMVQVIKERLATGAGQAEGAVLAILDLSRFATVNDTLGHGHGDQVLRDVAARLGDCGSDAVARVGGDSFAVLVCRSMSDDEIVQFLAEAIDRVSMPYELSGGHQALISASAGATHSGLSGGDADAMFQHADMALSVAKQSAGGPPVLYVPEMGTRLTERQEMDTALRQALSRGELWLSFQVQVDLATERTIGAEALLRWTHGKLGTISPDVFIPIAEETGQIVEIGRWALEEACRLVASWPGELRVAVNVSPIQFELSDVVEDVREALRKSGLPPERLDVELTEGIFVSHSPALLDSLEALRRMGIGIALDDFGTGYSSLSYLGRLPLDKIKIDQSFVRRLPADQESAAIVGAVLALSKTLGKTVVAEGLETVEQAAMLKEMGCAVGQGYLFGRPASSSAMLELLQGSKLTTRAVSAA